MARLPRLPLRFRIALSYFFTALIMLSLAFLLFRTWDEGSTKQLSRATQQTHEACEELRQKFVWGAENASFEAKKVSNFQNAILEIILERYDGIEGGFWSADKEFASYAYPTYDGASAKKDVPRSEMGALGHLAKKAIDENTEQVSHWQGRREAVYSVACPVDTKIYKGAAWVLMRVPILSGNEFDILKWLVAALLIFVFLKGMTSGWLLLTWTKDLRNLQLAIRNYPLENFPQLPPSHEPDLQEVVKSFNALNSRMKAMRDDTSELSRKLAQAERVTMLGQMAAGIAHEIRNPIATLKLKLENAAVQPAERFPKALPIMLDQVARVDRLVEMLLAMTRPFQLNVETVELLPWFENAFPQVQEFASVRKIQLVVTISIASWKFDAFHLSRALENILQNAIAFSPEGGVVTIDMRESEKTLIIDVQDRGAGIAAEDRDSLFRPFYSQRENGTGLGLVLAKEIVEAHGGRIHEIGNGDGACFRMEIPWPKS